MKKLIPLMVMLLLTLNLSAFAATTTYVYDELGRVHKVLLENEHKTITYEYDEIGNLLSKTISGNFTITASAGEGGTIFPSGTTLVTTGESVSYSIAASSGYRISTVTVDGVSQGPLAGYTFSSVTASHTINASFEPDLSNCGHPPVRIFRTAVYYPTLQDAYNVAVNDDVIQVLGRSLPGSLYANGNIAVTIEGGYSCEFNTNPGKTTMQGMANINTGTVTMKDIWISN